MNGERSVGPLVMFGRFFKKSKTLSEFEAETLPYSELLFGAALRMTRDEAQAEDLVQETFLKAYRFWDRYETGTNLKAWLLRIQTNEFINRYRKHQREKTVFDMNASQTALDRHTEAEMSVLPPEVRTQFLSELMGDEVMSALEELPVDFRMVVMLVDINDLSYKEVAEILDCPVGTVMSRLHRGRKMMRTALFDYAVERGVISPPATQDAQITQLDQYRRLKLEAER